MENKQHSSSTFPMSSATSTNRDTPTGDLGGLANEARSKLTEAAQQAGSQAKETAVSLASEANEKFKDLMTQRVTAGADLADHISGSVRIAADDLAKNAPQLAGLVRSAADRLENYSAQVRNKQADELLQDASDFARRQPAVVFGAAAVVGFILLRAFKVGSSTDYRQTPNPWPRGGEPRDTVRNRQFAGDKSASARGPARNVTSPE